MKTNILIEALFAGMRCADDIHRKWTGGYFITAGPESFLVSKIAEAIMDKASRNEYLFFEYGKDQINENEYCGIKGRLPKCFPDKGAIDLVLLNKEYLLQYAIEVKNVFGFPQTIYKDVERLQWLKRQYKDNGAFKAGVVAVFTSSKTQSIDKCKSNLSSGIDTIREMYGFDNVIWDEDCFTSPYIDKEDDSVSLGTYFCIIV